MAKKALVIALDYLKDSVKALEFALESFPTGYRYHLLHVLPRPHGFPLADESDNPEEDVRAASVKFMQETFLPKARSAGVEAVAEVVETKGDNSQQIGEAICEFAEKPRLMQRY